MPTEEFTLPRTGDTPLAFRGRLLKRVGGQTWHERSQPRWFELALFLSKGGTYVLAVSYKTTWHGEAERHWALVAEPANLRACLAGVNPTEHVQGFPVTHPEYRERQGRLMSHITRMYRSLVGELLADVGEVAEYVE